MSTEPAAQARPHVGPAAVQAPLEAATAPKAAAKSKRPFIILGMVALAVLLGVVAITLLNAGHESTDDAQVEADVVPVAPRVPGQVKRVLVQDNQRVKKGELVIELDDADYVAREAQAEAEHASAVAQAAAADAQAQVATAGARGGLSTAQASVSGSSVGVASADAQIAVAKAGLAKARADAHKAEIDLTRAKELRAASVIPQQGLDNAQATYEGDTAALEQATAQLGAAEEQKRAALSRVNEARGRFEQSAPVGPQIAVAQANAKLAHAREKSAQAMLDLARLQLSYTKVIAQENGQVSRLSVHEGQLVSVGQPMAALVPSQVYLVANFKETQVGAMKAGDKVEITIDAFPGRKLKGKVDSLAGGTGSRFSLLPPDNASGNFVKVVQRVPVRIGFVDAPKELELRAGLSADVTVYVK